MKFGEKYELLESLTTGGVETFVANDKIRGERVLVHILECEAQKPNQPTVQWVLEGFRRVAPEPAALVLETGRYSGTLYGYIVTKMPDEAALTKWVKLYRAQARETQDIVVPPAKPTAESEFPTADMTPKERPQVPGAVTPPVFRDFSPTAKPDKPNVPSKEAQLPAQGLPNVKPAGDHSAVRPTPDWNAVAPGSSAPGKADSNIGSPADSFSSAFAPRNLPSEPKSPAVKDSAGPGEFTSFFQGPFRVEGPAATPSGSPQQIEPPRKNVGEFTAMFNPPRSEEPLPAAGLAGNEPPGTGFTGWFSNPNLASRTSGTAGAPPSSGLPQSVFDEPPAFPAPPKEPFVPPQPVPYLAPTPVVSVPKPVFPPPPPPAFPTPQPPSPALEVPPVMPRADSVSEGATNAFNRLASEPAASQPAPPSGPSQYTQVISLRRSAGPAEAPRQAAANSPAQGFPSPSMPAVPTVAPPPMPAAPAMPKMAVPPAPKPGKGAMPEAPVSYWPLILTLTVLFFIAVLLVLYFALKH
jgi:hypothetical protein